MPLPRPETFGQIGYEAYGEAVDWKAYNGQPMLPWADLPERIQDAWFAAASAIVNDLGATIYHLVKKEE